MESKKIVNSQGSFFVEKIMAERTIGVDSDILSVKVNIFTSAMALGIKTKPLEAGLVAKGVRRYELYGAAFSLSPEEAQKRFKAVIEFAERKGISLGPEYKKVAKELKKGGDKNGS